MYYFDHTNANFLDPALIQAPGAYSGKYGICYLLLKIDGLINVSTMINSIRTNSNNSSRTNSKIGVSDLKSKVPTQVVPITPLYDESAAMLSQTPTIASRFPLFCQLDSSLYREILSNFPKLPTSILALELPNCLLQTHLYSSPTNDILIFGTDIYEFISKLIQE